MFCRYYNNCLNGKEAAIKAGYKNSIAEKIAEKLLEKKEICCFLEELKNNLKKEKILKLIVIALKRIILYRPNDTIKLLKNIETIGEEEIEKLDLFQISELKKLRDGSFEFKFIDRIKAIETLLPILEKMENNLQINSFLKALSAKPACDEQNE